MPSCCPVLDVYKRQYLSKEEALKAFVIWTMGSLGDVTVPQLAICLLYTSLISITDGTIFSKIITQEDMSQVSMFRAPSCITGSSVGIDPELNFKSIKNFK